MATWKRILVDGDVTGTSPIEVTGDTPTISLGVPSTTNALDDTSNDKLLVYDSSAGEWTSIPISSVQGSLGVVPHIEFNLSNPSSLSDGYLAYDADKDTLIFQSEHGEIAIGETYKPVYNNTGSTISKGTVLKATGVSGERFLAAPFDASSGVDEELYLIGIAQADIPNATEGVVVSEGYVKHLDTSSYSVGTILYASETAGAFTSTKPSSPNLGIPVAMVTNVDSTNGTIYVRPTLYAHLNELHDVGITNAVNGNVLAYDGTSNKWLNTSSLNVTNVSVSQTFDAANIFATTSIVTPFISLTGTGTSAISVGGAQSEDLTLSSKGNITVYLDSDNNESNQKFAINDPSTTERFSVSDAGVVRVNNAYNLTTLAPSFDETVLRGNTNGATTWSLPVYTTAAITQSFTLATGNCQKFLYYTGSSAITVTIPKTPSLNYIKDGEVLFFQGGTGSITIQGAQGVTILNTADFENETAGQYAVIGIKQLGNIDTWIITGERKLA